MLELYEVSVLNLLCAFTFGQNEIYQKKGNYSQEEESVADFLEIELVLNLWIRVFSPTKEVFGGEELII